MQDYREFPDIFMQWDNLDKYKSFCVRNVTNRELYIYNEAECNVNRSIVIDTFTLDTPIDQDCFTYTNMSYNKGICLNHHILICLECMRNFIWPYPTFAEIKGYHDNVCMSMTISDFHEKKVENCPNCIRNLYQIMKRCIHYLANLDEQCTEKVVCRWLSKS